MKLRIYEIHIFELRNEEINVKKILAVINATYAVAKRKPEKIRLAEMLSGWLIFYSVSSFWEICNVGLHLKLGCLDRFSLQSEQMFGKYSLALLYHNDIRKIGSAQLFA